jgi:hypothetical protein
MAVAIALASDRGSPAFVQIYATPRERINSSMGLGLYIGRGSAGVAHSSRQHRAMTDQARGRQAVLACLALSAGQSHLCERLTVPLCDDLQQFRPARIPTSRCAGLALTSRDTLAVSTIPGRAAGDTMTSTNGWGRRGWGRRTLRPVRPDEHQRAVQQLWTRDREGSCELRALRALPLRGQEQKTVRCHAGGPLPRPCGRDSQEV